MHVYDYGGVRCQTPANDIDTRTVNIRHGPGPGARGTYRPLSYHGPQEVAAAVSA